MSSSVIENFGQMSGEFSFIASKNTRIQLPYDTIKEKSKILHENKIWANIITLENNNMNK